MILKSGPQLMLGAVTFFAFVHAGVKFLGHIPFYEIVFFRALVSLIVCYVQLKQKGISVLGNNKKILILRGIFGTFALTLYFYTLQTLPLATAVTIQYLSPLLTIFLSGFMLKEKSQPIQWLFFIMAFVGVMIIQGFDNQVNWWPVGMGCLAALGSAVAYNLVRKLKDSDHELVIVFYFPLVTLPVVGPFLFNHWVTPQGWDWLILLGIGMGTQVAQVLMTRALHKETAAKVTIFKYLGVVYALLIGWFIFSESPSMTGFLGIFIVLLSVALSTRVKVKQVAGSLLS